MHRLRMGFAASALMLAATANAADEQQNVTGLPTYPDMVDGRMDATPRDTFGQKCTHFSATSIDALEKVESWYRKRWAGATESDVNKNSLYGGYFKLVGIRLSLGNDFMTIYHMQNQTTTSVELFRCGPKGS